MIYNKIIDRNNCQENTSTLAPD